jgi:hypothetical protein
MFITDLLIIAKTLIMIAKNWEHHKCSTTLKWMKSIYSVVLFSARKGVNKTQY